MNLTYLTTSELSKVIKYDVRTIREQLKDSVHYFRPFGGRKILYIWEHIQEDMMDANLYREKKEFIPMANGGVCYGY